VLFDSVKKDESLSLHEAGVCSSIEIRRHHLIRNRIADRRAFRIEQQAVAVLTRVDAPANGLAIVGEHLDDGLVDEITS